ncbi:MAG: HU family DNA-binding protein, partial [Muribaculaceae bacterium]|nr:HU family DNA-binding protein [Muribaculaceae bacterium]
MNNKITFPRLATMLADRSGRSKRFSEDFLREFFSLISETLEAGESVKIKGLGTFRLIRVEPRRSVDVTTGAPMEISGHSKVVFTPAKELAEAVNAPFEAFTAIEISDDTDIEQLLSKEELEGQDNTEEFSQDTYEEEDTTDTPLRTSEEIFENTKNDVEDNQEIVSEEYAETSEELTEKSYVDEYEHPEIIAVNNSNDKSLDAEGEKAEDYPALEGKD